MKLHSKIIGVLVFLLTLAPAAVAQEVAEKIQVKESPSPGNIIISRLHSGEQWLLKLRSCATALKAGDQVNLIVRGSLNASGDSVDLGMQRRCEIRQAIKFNRSFDILSTTRNRVSVADENGKNWNLTAFDDCGEMTNLPANRLYLWQFGNQPARGDKIVIPGEPKVCSLKTTENIGDDTFENPYADDRERPTRVTDVRAIPGADKATVYWRAAKDDRAVDHYLVSYSTERFDPKTLTRDGAPNQVKNPGTRIVIENLEADRDYYFYVMAVDAYGNESSFWSDPAATRTTSAATPEPFKQVNPGELAIRQIYESERTFIFEWQKPPTATRYMVTFQADGKAITVLTEYPRNELRIIKRRSHKGKPLRLTVQAFSPRGFINEAAVDFRF